MSILITDNWPKRGEPFIRVESKAAINDYAYESSSERIDQLTNARAHAAKESVVESTDVIDQSDVEVVPPAAPRRRRPG